MKKITAALLIAVAVILMSISIPVKANDWTSAVTKKVALPSGVAQFDVKVKYLKHVGETVTFDEKITINQMLLNDDDTATLSRSVMVMNVSVDCANRVHVTNSILSLNIETATGNGKVNLQKNEALTATALLATQAQVGIPNRLVGLTDENAWVCAH